jgi:hypothetical protein
MIKNSGHQDSSQDSDSCEELIPTSPFFDNRYSGAPTARFSEEEKPFSAASNRLASGLFPLPSNISGSVLPWLQSKQIERALRKSGSLFVRIA